MSDSMVGRVLFNVVRITLFVISASLFAIAYFLNQDNLKLDKWHKAEAKIFHSQIVKKDVIVFNRDAVAYDLKVKYAYIVDNKRYDSTNLFAYGKTPLTLQKQYFLEKAKQLKKGSLVEVYFNPENKSESYLLKQETGITTFYETSLMLLLFTVFLFLIQPVWAFISYKKNKEMIEKPHEYIVPENARRIPAHQRGR